MSAIGRVESVWRYPVKSMRGEQLTEIFAGFAGVYGDRLFAFKSSATPVGFPYLTGREAHEMLLYRPRFRYSEKAAKPANLAETEEISPILNSVAADWADLALDVETPSGEVLAIDDPVLLQRFGALAGEGHALTLLRSERAMTDLPPDLAFFAADRAAARGGGWSRSRQAALPGECLPGSRGHGRLFGERLRWPQGAHRIQGRDLRSRARPALPDDHARSRYRGIEPGGPTQRRARSRW